MLSNNVIVFFHLKYIYIYEYKTKSYNLPIQQGYQLTLDRYAISLDSDE
jgi:hypothetical protein